LREFRIRYGEFAGPHIVYDSVAEFQDRNPELKYLRWDQQIDFVNLEPGTWVEAEDGFVVQILKCSTWTSKWSVQYVIRFPMSTMRCYHRKTKPPRVPQFYAGVVHRNTRAISNSSSKALRMNDARSVAWAEFITLGADPVAAYRMVFGDNKAYTTGQMLNKILNLIHNPTIRKAIMSYLKNFKDKLKESISENDLRDKIVNHYKSVKKGSSAELAAIKFIHEIYKDADKVPFGILPARGRSEEATEANYEDVDPPMIANS